jgi:hypothetical protein
MFNYDSGGLDMSDYGADKNPDLNIATNLAFDKGLMNVGKPNVMQWTYSGGVRVQKLASKQGKSNMLLKLQE